MQADPNLVGRPGPPPSRNASPASWSPKHPGPSLLPRGRATPKLDDLPCSKPTCRRKRNADDAKAEADVEFKALHADNRGGWNAERWLSGEYDEREACLLNYPLGARRRLWHAFADWGPEMLIRGCTILGGPEPHKLSVEVGSTRLIRRGPGDQSAHLRGARLLTRTARCRAKQGHPTGGCDYSRSHP